MDDLDLGATIKGFSPGQKIFNRYTLKKILGRGGMGVVWLARDDELERDIAMKFLPEVVALDPEAVRDMKRETRRSLDLTHSNIIRIHDFIQDARTVAISMEYIAGSTLTAHKLEQPRGCFDVAELGVWTKQLCEALDYAHGKAQIVHRDLKPANLMIDARGDLKVADFGIAASVSDSVSRVSKQAGSSGTPLYMSPQQMMGEDPAVTDDIYSLGAVLYELLTGKPPFHTGNILAQVQTKVPVSVNERRLANEIAGEPVPAAWEATIAACLAKETKDRPQTAGEVAERLGLTTKDTKSTKADPGRANRPAEPLAKSKTENPKSKTPLYAALAAGVIALAALGYYFGSYAPEQARKAEVARLELQQKAAADTAEKQRLEIEAAKLRTVQEQAAVEAKAKQERERQAAEHLAAARGGLVIRTNPAGAEVRVGALALDKSPLTLKDQKLGKYPVRVRLDGYEEWTGEVEVRENDFADLDVTLVRSMGTLVITSTPAGAAILQDGKEIGRTPFTGRTQLGSYRLTLQQKGYKSAEVSGVVARNTELRLSAELEKQTFPQPGQPWENTLGQKFVPVPGTGVLFCIWEARVQDFEVFVKETGHDATQGMYSLRRGNWAQQGDSWKSPGFSQGPTHPVVGMNEADAKAFCAWLTQKERREGRLAADQEYRLPTDAEWDAAVGPDEFPWGRDWPPPRGAGNYAGSEARDADWNSGWATIDGYNDGFARTAPVGSFTANRYGIYDLGGNVWERVGDRSSGLRGASFIYIVRVNLASSYRGTRDFRSNYVGFRVVCAVGSAR
ncbi:MAG: protein kinase [Lacunisphaera sp.]|nr:protein kinase [Lacunisphaera sp.]